MAVDPKDFIGDLVLDGTDTLVDTSQLNLLNDVDNLVSPLVENGGDLDQDVSSTGGSASSGNGATNAGGVVTVGDDLKLTGHASAAADAEAAARGFTQDIETGGNVQANFLTASIVGSNVAVNNAGEDDLDNGDVSAAAVTQLGPIAPIGGALSGLAFPTGGTGTDSEFHISQTNTLNDQDTVRNAEVVNNDFGDGVDVTQNVTAVGGDASSGIGIDIDGAPLFDATTVGDDLDIAGVSAASADALAEAEAFTQSINVGGNVQVNNITASVVGGNQNLAQTGNDDFEGVDLVSDNEDDTETFFGSGPNGVGGISQANTLFDNETGESSILAPLVHNDGNPSASVAQVVNATGGTATTDDGIDTNDGNSNILSDVDVGDNLSVSGSASATADAIAHATAFTQNVVSGGNQQQNVFDASVVSGSQNTITVGEDNAGSPGFSPATISPLDSVVEAEDSDTRFTVSQSNMLNDDDTIETAQVVNGDIPDGFFDGGASLSQTVTATGGTATADDGIDADGLSSDAITLGDVGDDATISGTSHTSADAIASAEAFTQNLTTGGNVQINTFVAEVIGGSQTTIDVGEDDTEDLAMVISEDGATSTLFDVSQANSLDDSDQINDALVFNDAGSVVDQTASATGGTADSDDGITAIGSGGSFINSPASIAGDLSISGAADAHADALASAEAFTQSLRTGGNGQLNSFNASIVGASQNITNIAGDNAGDAGGANSPIGGIAGPTTTDVNLSQDNNLDDSDTIANARVINDSDPGFGGGLGGAGTVNQTVTATGGTAPGVGFSGDSAGIDADGLSGPIATVSVGDDASISGTSNATTDAIASAEAFTQNLTTGQNTQINRIDASVIGGNENAVLTGEDDLEGVDFAANADGETTSSLGNFVFEDGAASEDDPITQTNTLNDADSVTNPLVINEGGGLVNQSVSATGGDATTSDGITLGDTAEIVDVSGQIGDDLSITGTTSATADALAYAESFSQSIDTGGNVQLNALNASVVGGSQNTYEAGDDDGGSGDDDVDPGFQPLVVGLVEGTNTEVNVVQTNILNDTDLVLDPEVINEGGPGIAEGIATQSATANGGTAIAGDGIGGDSGSGSLATGGLIGDDFTIAASTNASASATAALTAFTQDIATGGNAQFNVASVSIVGGNNSSQTAGEDDTASGTLDIGIANVLGGTDTQLNLEQFNGGADGGAALDNDSILNPLVSNQSAGVGTVQGLEQDATADGGNATAGSGIDSTGGLIDADIGNDGSVTGLANAAANAAALTGGFNQGLASGENRQVNNAEAAIVGANKNVISAGEDDVAGGDDTAIAGLTGDADSLFIISQGNNLDDQDSILSPLVVSDGGDTNQIATANGGNATSGHGIQVSGDAGSGQAGDDFTINGRTIASADAIADASVFSQDISTGGNVQANTASASVIGVNDNLFFTGEDDGDDASDLPSLSPLVPTAIGEPDGEIGSDGDGTDTTFDITQVNSLLDNDAVFNPQVISTGDDSDTVQSVNAFGGTATGLDGVHGGDGGLFDSYSVLDDLLIEGVSQASANAYGAADAFTQNIVLGANVQVNTIDVQVVGGSTAINIVGNDDLNPGA